MLEVDVAAAATVEDVLLKLGSSEATGCLSVARLDGAVVDMYLRDGLLYAVSVPGRRARIGARLISTGRLTPDILSEALAIQKKELQGWRLGELLVHLGQVERSIVEAYVTEQLEDALTGLVGRPATAWRFKDGRKTRQDIAPPVGIPEVIARAVSRNTRWTQIEAALGGVDVICHLSRGGTHLDGASLKPRSWALLCRVDGRRTVTDLADACGFTLYEAADVVLQLVGLGVVEVPSPKTLVVSLVSVDDVAHNDLVLPVVPADQATLPVDSVPSARASKHGGRTPVPADPAEPAAVVSVETVDAVHEDTVASSTDPITDVDAGAERPVIPRRRRAPASEPEPSTTSTDRAAEAKAAREAKAAAKAKAAAEAHAAAEAKAQADQEAKAAAEAKHQAEQKRRAEQRAAADRAETARLAAEKAADDKAEADRLAAERAAADKAAADAEQLRRANEKAAADRAAANRAQREREAAERAAAERARAEQEEAERAAASEFAAANWDPGIPSPPDELNRLSNEFAKLADFSQFADAGSLSDFAELAEPDSSGLHDLADISSDGNLGDFALSFGSEYTPPTTDVRADPLPAVETAPVGDVPVADVPAAASLGDVLDVLAPVPPVDSVPTDAGVGSGGGEGGGQYTDTAALLRELSSLGGFGDDATPAPTNVPISRPIPSQSDKKKKRGLFGR